VRRDSAGGKSEQAIAIARVGFSPVRPEVRRPPRKSLVAQQPFLFMTVEPEARFGVKGNR
jgi:hypothetical protein